ncbi:protein tyrosine phosphatase [Dorcoceras hygrometricum]|uniref:Protein tyrosine phosphatase n=1 Tax=Dorcoceras hygrometricum TaxID=472368 RepID=A0A2Z7CR78_9LAMI|nr:protein tyrosine phosphatase [Dorcoceras hygrometricum]
MDSVALLLYIGDDDPLDISWNTHIGSSVGAIPRDVGLGRLIPLIDHEEHGLPELSSDIHRDDTNISTEPDLFLSVTDEDDGRDANDRFDDIGPSHVNISYRMHLPHHDVVPLSAAPIQPSLYESQNSLVPYMMSNVLILLEFHLYQV